MIGNLMHKGTWRFPEIGPVVQSITDALSRLRSSRKHAMLASVAGVAVVAVAFTAAGYVRHARNIADARTAASRVESANMDLQDELARLRDQIAASNRELAAAQNRVVALTEEMQAHPVQAAPQPAAAQPASAEAAAQGKGDKVAQLSQQLHVAEAQRATLAARLSKAEADLADIQAKQADLMAEMQKKLDQISSDRDRLKARVDVLEKQSALRHAQQEVAAANAAAAQRAPAAQAPTTQAPAAQAPTTQAPAAQAPAAQAPAAQPPTTATVATVPAPRPQAEEPQRVAGVLNAPQTEVAPAQVPAAAQTAAPTPVPAAPALAIPIPAVASAAAAVISAPVVVAHGAIDQVGRVLASAGVDVRHLFAEYGVNRGEGGPFIPAPRGTAQPETLSPEKLAALRAMVKVLPVSAPLESFRITSPFGVRADPENDRAGFHTGVDLAAPYDTPVYSTAPGVVTFAGYRDDYGKIVEIDHGNGIATRYAHLHAYTVSVGEKVGAHQQVGYLGSTGRATGPHVHYEVVVNGEPQDPEKFFGLARYVQSATIPVSARN